MNGIIGNINRWSNSAGLVFLCLLLATFMNEHINAVRNIGLYVTAIMAIIYLATQKFELKIPDGYGIVLILLSIVILQGVVRNEYGPAEGFYTFRRTYFKAYVLAIGIMLFVNNSRAISITMWSLFVSAISVLSNGVYSYVSREEIRFYYDYSGPIHQSAHLIDFIDAAAVIYTRHHSRYIRYTAIAVLVGFTVLIIGTGSRGGWLAFVAGFIVTYFLINTDKNVALVIIKSSARVAAVVIGIYMLAPVDSYVHHKFNKRIEAEQRTDVIFPVYTKSIVSGPLFGYGYTNNIEDRVPNVIGADQSTFDKALSYGPHNQFLLFGVHFGIIGMLVYIVTILWTLFRLINRAINSPSVNLRLLSAAGAGMLMAEYIVRSMTDPVFKHWIGIPIGIALITLREDDR